MKERVQTAIDEVLRPLLEADGGGVELLHVGPTRVSLRLRGKVGYMSPEQARQEELLA